MFRTLTALAATAFAADPARAAPADPAPVIAAEQAFAAKAAEVGIGPSFLAFMADEAIVFNPDAVSAKALYSARKPGKPPKEGGTLLAWWPNFAGIARSGDLGFTTGPASVNGKPASVFYFTVWAKQPDGAWRWVFDGGVQADGAAAPGPDSPPRILPPGDRRPISRAAAWAQVRAAEARVEQRSGSDSAGALKAVLAPDARVQGPTAGPASHPTDREWSIVYRPIGGGAARAGDLVWTWGDAAWESGEGHYVRVWQRRREGWRIVFDQILAR